MSISITSLLPNSTPSQIQAKSATHKEVYDLVNQGLVGEFTTSMAFMSDEGMHRVEMTQWSEQANNQWWALMEAGPAGVEAAGYLEQMVEQRWSLRVKVPVFMLHGQSTCRFMGTCAVDL